jgi:hypothetical protein
MSGSTALPDEFAATRAELQRVATHVLARSRAAHGGRFGLRVTPTGIATPPFGDDDTVIRVAGTDLVVERQTHDGVSAWTGALSGLSLAGAVAFVDGSLDGSFAPGADAPPVGDPDRPLALHAGSVDIILGWYRTGAGALDAVLPHLDRPSAAQLWSEHFDLGLQAQTAAGGVTLGASPGDAGVAEPYLYVAPWTDARPGDPDYWNAPYGAVATRATLVAGDDPVGHGATFIARGLGLLNAP